MAIKTELKPRQKDYSFDLQKGFNSIVSVHSNIPSDAFTAPILGTERGGNGIVIKAVSYTHLTLPTILLV